MFWTLFGYMPSLENIVPFDSKHVAMCLRRKRAEVTNFSTWGGSMPSIVWVKLQCAVGRVRMIRDQVTCMG
jgi:hypothetical protein